MRKSSTSVRTSGLLPTERRSRGRSTDGQRSSLLQPGFATRGRRSSSEQRESSIGIHTRKSNVPLRRSRSQLSLQPSLTPRRDTISPAPSRTTPSDAHKHSSKFLTGTSVKSRRDVRNFADKAVLAAATVQVTNYFVHRDIRLNLRQPVTLKTFLECTGFLLNELNMTINLTNANYVEEIPYYMRLLNYPGSLAPSWLKTAYAQHCLTNVVALWSWLVELIESTSDVSVHQYWSDTTTFRILPVKDYYELFATAFVKWNQFQPEDSVLEDFYEKLRQAYIPNIDEAGAIALSNEIEALSAKCEPDNDIMKLKQDLEEEYHCVDSDVAKLKLHLKNTKKYISTLDKKIETFLTEKEEWEGKLVNIQVITEQIRQQVVKQEMSVDEMNELLQTCEHIRGRIRSGENCISELNELAFKSDRSVVEMRTKFNEKMDRYNKLLVMESCAIPQLAQLQIKMNVLSDCYLDEATEVDKALLALHKELLLERPLIDEELAKLTSQLEEMLQSRKSCEQEILRVREKLHHLETQISNLKHAVSETEANLIEELKHIENEIDKKLKDNENVALEEELQRLQATLEKWQDGFEKLKFKGERFFKDNIPITANYIAEVQKLRALKEDRLKKMIEQKKSQGKKRN